MKHRWGDKVAISPNKTERECTNGCGIVKVTRHEAEGGRTPPCTGPVRAATYDARNYPL